LPTASKIANPSLPGFPPEIVGELITAPALSGTDCGAFYNIQPGTEAEKNCFW